MLDFNQLYQNNLGRAADAGGLSYWQGLANSGMSDQDLKNAFYASAAKEAQGNDSGLSPQADAWDENRIAQSMSLYDSNPALGGGSGYWKNAGDTATTSAADRLATPAQPVQQAQPQQNLGMGGGLNSTFGNPFSYDQKNPYLQQMAGSITNQVTDNLNRNILPNISSGAQLAGVYGGSRQGVVEANALKDANTSLSNALTGMYYGDYNNAMNRQLSKYQGDQGFYTAQRGLDLNATQLGANLFNMGNQGYMGQGQSVYNLGLTQQQAPWQTTNNMNSAMTPYTGYGSTSMTQNGSMGANIAGGALMGSQLYKNLGLSGGSSNSGTGFDVVNTGGLGLQGPTSGFWAR